MASGEVLETSLLVVLVFVAPGYLALAFSRALRGAKGGRSTDLPELIWSILLSVLIAATLHFTHRFPSVEATGNWMIEHVVRTVITVAGLSLVWGAVAAIVLEKRERFIEWFRSRVLFGGASTVGSSDELWDMFMRDNAGGAVLVDTEDGRTFKGIIWGYSKEDEPLAIELMPAIEVTYEDDGTPIEWVRGDHMLLVARDIRRIIRLDDENVSTEVSSSESAPA